MPLNPLISSLDQQQIIQRVMDSANDRLRVDASVSAVIGDVVIDDSTSSVAIGDRSSGDLMKVNADGSIDVNTILDSATDSVAVRDPISHDALKVNADGSINVELEGLNSFQTTGYVIGTSAVQVVNPPLANRSSVGFKAVCSTGDAIYIGNSSSVTITNGWPLFNGDAVELDLTGAQQVWAIATSASQNLFSLELA
jgi:hypothetical protein